MRFFKFAYDDINNITNLWDLHIFKFNDIENNITNLLVSLMEFVMDIFCPGHGLRQSVAGIKESE